MKNLSIIKPSLEITRRQMFAGTAGVLFTAAAGGLPGVFAAKHELPPLPYAENALEPVISARTIGFHYGRHHLGYLNNLNKQVAGTPMEKMSLEEIMMATVNDSEKAGVFNNAAQVWNHTFYWRSLKPGGASVPPALKSAIDKSFGSLENLKKDLSEAAVTQFASGWAWLVRDGDRLKVEKTPNAHTPFTGGRQPLLTIDVWEHAYYLDYQNRRADHVAAVIDKLLNWDFALENYRRK
ncbi:MAG TPA: superoxide dismutase [Acidobacteriota bacterium]|nr:superoxide dismutase [Acidobacteriota bacterium]